MTSNIRTALVLGATGGIGGETARALGRHGWKIRALARSGRPADSKSSWEWIKGDALDRDSIVAAAQGSFRAAGILSRLMNPKSWRRASRTLLCP